MSAKMTKEKFMQTLRLERLKWRALLDEVGESRMLVPNAIGIWSVLLTMSPVIFFYMLMVA